MVNSGPLPKSARFPQLASAAAGPPGVAWSAASSSSSPTAGEDGQEQHDEPKRADHVADTASITLASTEHRGPSLRAARTPNRTRGCRHSG